MKIVDKDRDVSVIEKHLVWVEKTDDDDWGRVKDDVYLKWFIPNRAAVIVNVNVNSDQFWVSWIQVREENEHFCSGTAVLGFGWFIWAEDIKQFAIDEVRRRLRDEVV